MGPNVTLRRSSRNADDGRTILDKAQEFKRKWNLESNAGINAKAQNHVSKALLISVAKDLDVVGVDGNPQVLDRMIALDRQRSLDNHLGNNNKVGPNSTNSGVDLVDNGGAQGDKDLTPPKNVDKSLAGPLEADQEAGRSLRDSHADFVGIMETKKSSFSYGLLKNLSSNKPFSWCYLESKGTAGGIL